jgi:hypothetical protein
VVPEPEWTLRKRENSSFEVLSVVSLEIQVICDMMQCGRCLVVHVLKALRFFETSGSTRPTTPWHVSENLTLQEGNFCSCPEKIPCF